ncbi:MAG TPA: TetR/AcrR family transcriptional regulator [Thermoleophilaceae bacterium]|nr:TetR/AcrR family transcriptional regulator [Thermoleophilaceae bacterium]
MSVKQRSARGGPSPPLAAKQRSALAAKQRRPRAFGPRPNRPEQILAAACRAIQQRGFANTRIADIAAEADMSTGAIHYWFEVKDEVLIAALKWASGQLFDRLERLAAEAGSERERLALLLEHAVPVHGPRRGEYVLWIELWVRALQEPDLLPECEALSRRWRGYFFETVRRGAEAGEFSPVPDPDDAAERLLALADGLGFELLLEYSWTSPERMRKRLYAFAAEQLGIERKALERDAKAVAALLDGEGG